MPLATFQNKVFNVSSNKIDTFFDLTWGGGLDTEAQEKLNSKPSTYVKGSTLDSISFIIPLRAHFGHNVRREIEEWETIKERAKPDIFTLGSRPLGKNKWLLKTFTVTDSEIDNQGNILKAELKLEFEEYVREGQAEPKNTAVAPGSMLNLMPNLYAFDPPNKADEKRDNPNMFAALLGGISGAN